MSEATTTHHLEYNGTVTQIRRVHDELLLLRVAPDEGVPDFEAGQYTTLGLLTSEQRVHDGAAVDGGDPQLIRRAYSIGSPVLDESNALVRPDTCGFLEFYIALVWKNSDSPPSLTPRIFALETGDRLYVGPRPRGTYTLQYVQPDDDVIFVATGTGEAPHNAMITELLLRKHRGRIASFVCVRYKNDLAYLDVHRKLQQQFSRYTWVPLTTREPENTDRGLPGYVGKHYLQDVFAAPDLQERLTWLPSPDSTHVFLCGHPAMIGVPKGESHDSIAFPDPRGMIETLVDRGFRLDRPRNPGNIHFERYW